MEKKAVIEEGLTPIEEEDEGVKSASDKPLEEDCQKRLSDVAEKKTTCQSASCLPTDQDQCC